MSSNIFPAFRDEPPPMDDFDLDDEDDAEFGSFASFSQTTTVTKGDLSSVTESVSTTKTINGGSHIESTPDSWASFPTDFEAPVWTPSTSDSQSDVMNVSKENKLLSQQSHSVSNKTIDVIAQSGSTLKGLIDSAVSANKNDNDDDEDWGDFDGGTPKDNTISSSILESREVENKPDDDTTNCVKDKSAGIDCTEGTQQDGDNADDWGDFDSHSAAIEPETKCVPEPETNIPKSCVEAEAMEQEISSDSLSGKCQEGPAVGQLQDPCVAQDLSLPNSLETEADRPADCDVPPVEESGLNNALAGECIASSENKSEATGVSKLHEKDAGLDNSEHCPEEQEFSDSWKVDSSVDAMVDNSALSDSSARSEGEASSETDEAAIGERLTEDHFGATLSESISAANCPSEVDQVDDGNDGDFKAFSSCSADGNGTATEKQLSEEPVPSNEALQHSASSASHKQGRHEGGDDDEWGVFDGQSTDKDTESVTLQATEQSKGATDEAQKDVSPVSSVPETQDADHEADSSEKDEAEVVEEEPAEVMKEEPSEQLDGESVPPNSTSDVTKADEADSGDWSTFGGSSANKDEEVVPQLDTEEVAAPDDIKDNLATPDDETRADEDDEDEWSAFDSHSRETTEQTPQVSAGNDSDWTGFGSGGGAEETGDSWSAFGNSSRATSSKADDVDKGDEEEDWAGFGSTPVPANPVNAGSDDDFGDFSTDVTPAIKSERPDMRAPRKSDIENKPTPAAVKADDDDDLEDFASPAPVPQSRTEDDGDDGDFDDFAVAAPPSSSKAAEKGDDDEFGDFSSETTTKAATPSVPASARLSQRKELFSRAISQSFGEADDEAETKNGDSDVPQLLQWVWTVRKAAAEESTQHVALRCVWEKLLEAESGKAPLVLRWGSSQCSKSVLAGLRIDSRNVLTAGKKANVPVFAAQIGLLQPLKPGEVAPRPETAAPDNSATPNVLVDTQPDSSAVASQSSGETVLEAEFDWTGSGLENPLQGGEGASLDLDFFSTAPSARTKGTHTHSLEAEFLSSPTSSPVKKKTEEKKPGALDSLLSRLTGTATAAAAAARDDKLGEEARSLISRLPDLSFMSASVLMFPVKQEGLGDSGKRDET